MVGGFEKVVDIGFLISPISAVIMFAVNTSFVYWFAVICNPLYRGFNIVLSMIEHLNQEGPLELENHRKNCA